VRIATWNVNSIRARHERLLAWLEQNQPDVMCLQEIKVEEEAFPTLDYAARGYEVALLGQRTYNGVALLSRTAITEVQRGLPGSGEHDPQARFIAGTIAGVRVASIYAPNGQTVGSDKWDYKLRFFDRLCEVFRALDPQQPLALCGDFNVAPDERDVYDPVSWEKETLFHPEARAALARLCACGFRDAYRIHSQEAGKYTWWDYRQLGFPKNRGLRIDHILLSEALAQRCRAATIDREARKGKQPSDHAPVYIDVD
jgi:exodeoxyribonuclease-3